MRKQAFQPGEIRDEQNNIIRPGAYGKNSAFATAANDGILDYIINNFDALYDTLTGGMLYVDSLPESGDASKLYVIKSTGKCYRYDGAKFVLMDGAAVDFISNAKLAEDGTMTLTTDARRSLSVTLDPVNAIADKAQKSADAAEKARNDANSAVAKLTGVMKYAGQANNYSDLSDMTKNRGDVWNIVNADSEHGIKAGDNVVWNGSDWDNLSGVVDLSAYAEKADYQKAITSATANGATITFNHKDGSTSTTTVNNVASATAATNDAKGQKIDATYEKIADASNVHTSLQNSISTKQDKLTFDTTPTANSSNPVTSDGIKKAIDAKTVDLSNYYTKTQVDTAIASASSGGTSGDTSHATRADQDGDGNIITDTYYKKSDAVAIHASLQDSINTKQDRLTFDTTPTAGSSNPVTSDGIRKAIANAISAITDGDNKSY